MRATRIRLRKMDALDRRRIRHPRRDRLALRRRADHRLGRAHTNVNVEDAIRIANRFGGGMNPAMVVVFFLIAGVVYRHRRWIAYGVAMALAGAAAGVSVQIVKYTAGRTRPELWLGPFHHARAAATSFPSGHTVGAFALAGVLMLASPSRTMRIIAFLLALSVAVSRVLAFRHWTSDVLASAAIGMILAAVAVRRMAAEVSFRE